MRKGSEKENREFKKRQTSQIIAMTIALFLVLSGAVVFKRPDIFGAFSSKSLMAAQAVVIAVFIGFSSVNWRCPSCNKYLGADIHRSSCRKCGVRFY
jgi:hypothetical protein